MADGADLSVVLITRNAAARIRRRLQSARWAGEVVVVDQPSPVTRISALWVFVAKPLLVFLRKHVRQRGLLEGTHGIIRCAMAGCVGFVNSVRLWELTGDRAG